MSTAKTKRLLTGGGLKQIAAHFRMLGEPMRLKILQAVCHEPRTVGAIVTAVGATQANVSKHLSLLAGAGMLSRRRAGQSVYYGLQDDLTLKMCALVQAHRGERTARRGRLSPKTVRVDTDFRPLPPKQTRSRGPE